MTVEIKELVIRAVVVQREPAGAESASRVRADAEREAVIAACVKEVLRALKKSRER